MRLLLTLFCMILPVMGFAQNKPDTLGPSQGGQIPTLADVTTDPRLSHELAIESLSRFQEASFTGNREYCGYFVLHPPSGIVYASAAIAGTPDSCGHVDPEPGSVILAIYHTHGRYLPRYNNEIPSSTDMRLHIGAATDGYVATPGGKLWFIDTETQRTYLVCRQCLPVDPGYNPADDGVIPDSMSVQDILAREGR